MDQSLQKKIRTDLCLKHFKDVCILIGTNGWVLLCGIHNSRGLGISLSWKTNLRICGYSLLFQRLLRNHLFSGRAPSVWDAPEELL